MRFFVVALLAGASWAHAASPLRVPMRFSITNDAGWGNEWFVVGNHPDLGAWDPAKSVKLVWSNGNVWWGHLGVQAGTALEYKFVKRATAADQICDGANAVWWPDDANLQTQAVAEPPAPFHGKKILFYSDMTNVNVVFAMLSNANFDATVAWTGTNMVRTGPGLRAGDWRHEAGIGEAGEWMRFTFNGLRNGITNWEGAWDGWDYWSPLDAMIVRDRQIFNYLPPASGVSASRVVATNVGSSFAGVAGRDVRIYLPRGYNENTNRRYPVVYMSDGENVFAPGGTYGCWNAETTADAEIKGGRMREAIVVGVPSAADRTIEYLPHMDSVGGKQGKADMYANFLIHNVRPTLDAHFRTKNDRANTACIGSSSGGLLAMYLGTWTNAFGLVGAMSGVYDDGFCPNYMAWLASARPHAARVWMDVGNVGYELDIDGISLYDSNFTLYWHLLGIGYVPRVDLRFAIGCGHDHNEAAWAARLPEVYRFLLDAREEPNVLLPFYLAGDGSGRTISFPVYAGTSYVVERTGTMATPTWIAATNWARETRPWNIRTVDLEALAARSFVRVAGH